MAKVDDLITQLNRDGKFDLFSKGLATYSGEKIPFTSPRMNYLTHGGLPEYKIIEFLGVEHGGKTTTALDEVHNFQVKENRKAELDPKYVKRSAFWFDIENALDTEWAVKMGVDVDSMYYFHAEEQSAEEIFDFIKQIIKTGDIGLFVLDSIAAMVSEDELKKEFGDKSFGGISGPLSRFAKELSGLTTKYKCTFIGLNQVRDDINSTWGGYKTPGGRTWKHMCAARFDFRKGKFIDENGKEVANNTENPNGTIIACTMVKNRHCPPDRRVGFYTLNWNGIDYIADLVEVAIKVGVIEEVTKAYFQIKDLETNEYLTSKIHGQHSVEDFLSENEEICKRVEEQVNEQIA